MKETLSIREPEATTEWDAMFDLRWRVLRKPWNQPKGSEKDDLEDKAIHIIAIIGKRVVGTARLQKNTLEVGQIRYMAIDPEYQRKGIGKQIILTLQQRAKQLQLKKLMLDAREPSLEFYNKLGYKIVRKSYVLFSEIQHWQMEYEL
jgi:N-acetylglutamate synthase-like GNAT family acetyltransferase